MKKGKLLPILAFMGVEKNYALYLPYIGVSIFSVFLYFTFGSILHHDIMGTLPRAAYVWMLMQIGYVLLAFILLPFLFYTNSFILKRRKRELGLYSILGMEKKHIGMIMFYEGLGLYVVTLVLGVIFGLVFSKLVFLILLNMTGLPVYTGFPFSKEAFFNTAKFFGIVYALNFISSLVQIGKANPIELLSGAKKGEKELKHIWLYTIAGLITLGYGYYIALTSKLDTYIFTNFFLAVFLVVIGTYFLLTSGSVALLNVMKRKKSYYYQPQNFITLSGMLYRMKKNAAGLVNICIFSTMVVITLLCTAALYSGTDGILAYRYPYDVKIVLNVGKEAEAGLENKIKELETEFGVKAAERVSFSCERQSLLREGERFTPSEENFYQAEVFRTYFMSLEEYNRISGRNVTLSDQEILLYTTGTDYGKETAEISGETYQVKEELSDLTFDPKENRNTFNYDFYIIGLPAGAGEPRYFSYFNLEGDEENKDLFMESLASYSSTIPGFNEFQNSIENRADTVSMFGGLLFIGVFFGFLFMVCLLIIMYYKQITEGYEDRDSFLIMQKVGMDDREVKSTIKRQVLMVFFFPLLGAVCHTMAAIPMIDGLLGAINLFNTPLILMCALMVVSVFLIIYAISYFMTARTYYKIVRRTM